MSTDKLTKVLANGKSEFVGILLPNLFLHYYSEMSNQILSTYETLGYKFLVFTGNGSEDIERKYLQELLAYKIEGLIVLSHTISSAELTSYPSVSRIDNTFSNKLSVPITTIHNFSLVRETL